MNGSGKRDWILLKIAERAWVSCGNQLMAADFTFGDVAMRLGVADRKNHFNLDALLSFDRMDFSHDVLGIIAHTDKRGYLRGCFWPRCGSEVRS